ncbi:MAG: hypothetical protein M3340_09275, partial [Actinomycetota bacterium]|nr:hypothetical protein [Actinomycetota bacterium]
MSRRFTLAAAVLAATLAAAPAEARRGQVELISATPAGQPADGYSFDATPSRDGRFISFSSFADNLSDRDDDTSASVFVKDMRTGELTLVNRAADGGVANGPANNGSISADGRRVAFASFASNMTTPDGYGWDVFVGDMDTGRISLVSRQAGSGDGGNRPATSPEISADGRFVAFSSNATNLSPDQTDETVSAVYVRDLVTGELTLASRADSEAVANGGSRPMGLSADGRRLAFVSSATNLDPADTDATQDVYVRDLASGETTLISDDPRRADSRGESDWADISDDGRHVVFHSGQVGLSDEDDDGSVQVYVRDLETGATTLASGFGPSDPPLDGHGDMKYPAIAGDGQAVAFSSMDRHAVVTWNRVTRKKEIVADGALGAEISGDHRYALYGTGDLLWRRDMTGGSPFCLDVIQRVTPPLPAFVTLPCLDEDGDPFSRLVVAPPAHGLLGPIDQHTGAVLYTPLPGFVGEDTFVFAGTGADGQGRSATARLVVDSPELPPLPPVTPPAVPPVPAPLRCADPLVGT